MSARFTRDGLRVNPFTGGVCITDEIIHDVYDGNAFSYFNYYKLGKNKSKTILIRRPGPKYGVLVGTFAVAKYDADMNLYASPTVHEWGDPPSGPVPLPRNTDPDHFRLPYLEIYEDSDISGGIHTGAARIEQGMKDNTINYLERAVYAWSEEDGLYGLIFKNYYNGDNYLNLYLCWSETLK
jgi:hypothetical protein